MELTHPERFVRPEPTQPLAKWNGNIAELLELAIPVHSAGKLKKLTGEPMAFSDVVGMIESVCSISIHNPYARKEKLL